jgi:hypothetical protein
MPGFSRKAIAPNKGFITNLVARGIASWIPTGFRWFEPTALQRDHEFGKQIMALAKMIADLRHGIEVQRYNIFLASAVGDALDDLAKALGFKRRVGENDDTLATRIAAELVAERVTPGAIERFVPLITDGAVHGSIFEPWRHIWILGDNTPPGQIRFADQRYWHGGVFELQTDGYVPNLDEHLENLKACGVFYWKALLMESLVDWVDDPLAAIWPLDGHKMDFVSSSVDVSIESYGTGTDFDAVSMDIVTMLDMVIDAGTLLTWCTGLRFDILSRNYVVSMDMLASASSGSPVYVLVDKPLDPRDPTDIQPPPEIHFEIYMDDGWDMDEDGPALGP